MDQRQLDAILADTVRRNILAGSKTAYLSGMSTITRIINKTDWLAELALEKNANGEYYESQIPKFQKTYLIKNIAPIISLKQLILSISIFIILTCNN